jgi:hypothetical protein
VSIGVTRTDHPTRSPLPARAGRGDRKRVIESRTRTRARAWTPAVRLWPRLLSFSPPSRRRSPPPTAWTSRATCGRSSPVAARATGRMRRPARRGCVWIPPRARRPSWAPGAARSSPVRRRRARSCGVSRRRTRTIACRRPSRVRLSTRRRSPCSGRGSRPAPRTRDTGRSPRRVGRSLRRWRTSRGCATRSIPSSSRGSRPRAWRHRPRPIDTRSRGASPSTSPDCRPLRRSPSRVSALR